MDNFGINDGFEYPGRWEETLLRAFQDGETDADLADVLGYAYLEQDHAKPFNCFFDSPGPTAINKLPSQL